MTELERQLRVLAVEIDRINSLGGRLEPGEIDTGPGIEGWPSQEACDIAFKIAEHARREPAALATRMRVCKRCGTQAGTDPRAEPICSDQGLVSAHAYVDLSPEISEQVVQLRRSRWKVRPFGVRDGWLLIDGFSPSGSGYRGHITASGHLVAEPADGLVRAAEVL